jgi:hypothetical protein
MDTTALALIETTAELLIVCGAAAAGSGEVDHAARSGDKDAVDEEAVRSARAAGEYQRVRHEVAAA